MNMKKSRGISWKIVPILMAIAISMIFSASLALAYESDEGYGSASSDGEWAYDIDLSDEGGIISYTIDDINGGSVNVMLMTYGNYLVYSMGGNYHTVEDDEDISWSVSNTEEVDADIYVLVVESSDGSDVDFHYSVTYGSDYNPSFWDFIAIGGFSALICGVGLIFLIIWIYVLIWVYKDAKKRGKSGGLWLLIVLLLGIIGLIIWLIVRPPERPPGYIPPNQGYAPPPQYQQQSYQQAPPPQYPPQQPPQQPAQQSSIPTQPMRCPNCGAEVQPGADTCPYCGAKL